MAKIIAISANDEVFDPLEILQSLPTALLVINQRHEIIFSNEAAENLFRISQRIMVTRGLSGLFASVTGFEGRVKQVFEGQSTLTLHDEKIELSPYDESLVHIHLTPLVMAPYNENSARKVLISIEKVENTNKLNLQQTNQVGSLAEMLAHEVKNPLSGIRGAAQLLEQNANEDDQKLTEIITRECDRIRALVDSMEHFSNEQILEFEALNIHHILDHVVDIAKAGFGRDIHFKHFYDPSLPMVLANRDALIQVFLNLVKNAAEAIDDAQKSERGEINIKTAFSHQAKYQGHIEGEVFYAPIEITISDNGNGIDEGLLANLFDPFVTNKKMGKGLGLALVKKLIHAHKGHVAAENNNHGAQFKIYLRVFEGAGE